MDERCRLNMNRDSVFKNKKPKTIILVPNTRFPQGMNPVDIPIVGADKILSPVEKTWDSFFLSTNKASEDFISERARQVQAARESLEEYINT